MRLALPEPLQRKLASGALRRLASTFAAAAISRAGLLALAIVLAQSLGPAHYGVFTYAVGAANLCAAISNLGWPKLVNRLIPSFIKEERWGLLRGFCLVGDGFTFLTLAISAGIMLLLSMWASDVRSGLVYGAILTIPLGFALLRMQQLSAVRRPAVGAMFDQGFSAIIVSLIALAFGLPDLNLVVLLFGGITMLGVGYTTWVFHRNLPRQVHQAPIEHEMGGWLKMTLPMMFSTISRQLLTKTDVLMLAPLSTMAQVGLYGAAFRLTYLMTFPQQVLMLVLTPALAEAHVHGRPRQTIRAMRLANLYALVTTAPVVLVFVLAPGFVLTTVFGSGFEPGATTLMVLALSQLPTAFGASYSSLMLMSDLERPFALVNGVSLLVNIALNLILIPPMGAEGAAWSALVTQSVRLAGLMYYSRPLLRTPA